MKLARGMRNLPLLLLSALAFAAITGGHIEKAAAQAYPSRPITMIVPFAAGGPSDVIGRIVADRMRVSLGQPIIVENVTSASGTLGVARSARSAPDGYTLGLGTWPTHVLNGAIFQSRPQESAQGDKWSFCLTAGTLCPSNQEKP
jgi:tripartite-type tricarboxylate transporter receptor subunit TctC